MFKIVRQPTTLKHLAASNKISKKKELSVHQKSAPTKIAIGAITDKGRERGRGGAWRVRVVCKSKKIQIIVSIIINKFMQGPSYLGATTFRITTLSIATRSIMTLCIIG
jgi:hypothetical protein